MRGYGPRLKGELYSYIPTYLTDNNGFALITNRGQPNPNVIAPTNVSFEMLADKGGTQFKVIHNGFKYLPEGTQEEICQQYKDYWASNALPHLKTLIENS